MIRFHSTPSRRVSIASAATRSSWNSFNFRNAQDSEVCLPLMKPIQRVVIGTEIFWKTRTSNGFLKHPTKRQAINNATLDPKSDDSARVLIHNDQYPIRLQAD